MRSFIAAATLLGVASASPYAYTESNAQDAKISRRAAEPCGIISEFLSQFSNPALAQIDPSVALQCLQSVPLNTADAQKQLNGIDAFTDFQSTLAYLKDPTPGYMYPAVDFKGGLKKISDSLQNGDYTNEYDFQHDILKLIIAAKDGHFIYLPDITQIFSFQRDTNLLSLSKDGQSLPEIYCSSDIGALAIKGYSNYTASPVTKINGEPVETFLNDLATAAGTYQDPDANYNSMLENIAQENNYQGGLAGFVASPNYQGPETILTFKNGTTKNVLTWASTSADFTGVTDGASFFKKFCTGHVPTASVVASSVAPSSIAPSSSFSLVPRAFSSSLVVPSSLVVASSLVVPSSFVVAPSAVPSSYYASASAPVLSSQVPYAPVPSQNPVQRPTYFPKPWLIAHDRSIACYYPVENQDLAVLSVPSFEPGNYIEFEDIVRQCLATSSKLGKKKLVLDFRGNGGGNVLMAYDMFKQLFPAIQPWGTTNFRAFDLFNDIGKVVTAHYDDTTPANAGREGYDNNFSSIFNSDEELDGMYKDFTSWADFYGPVHVHGDTFTSLVRYNLSDPYQASGFGITGYGDLDDIIPKATFDSENIVLLQDGGCASTCAVFAEFMKTQADVRSIAIGGRSQYGPMQGVGGTKGANVYTVDYLKGEIEEAFEKDATASQQNALEQKYGDDYQAVLYALERAAANADGEKVANVNIRNNIRKGDSTLTPLQFVYEAADCRLFYTPSMVIDQSLVWKAAYDAEWGSGKCVQGSTNQESADPGTDYILTSPDGATTATPSKSPWGPSPTGQSPSQSGAAGGRNTASLGVSLSGVVAVGLSFLML